METAFGPMQFTPEVFWKMTETEFLAAFNGKMAQHTQPEPNAATRDDLEYLMAKFPDEKPNGD